MSLLNF